MQTTRSWLDRFSAIAFIAACLAVVWAVLRPGPVAGRSGPAERPSPPLPAEPITIQASAIRGNPQAAVAIVEYADFECPFCIRFAREVLPSLDEKYVQSGKVLMVFKHLPLPSHRAAFPAAEAAECAGAQQRFWEMHDRLFERPDELSSTDLRAHAGELGLDRVRFETCLEGQMKDRVQSDADLARTLKVGGTPTFFIGRVESGSRVRVLHRLAGAQPIAAFAEVLDRLIARK